MVSGTPRVIEVMDPGLKGLEGFINRMVENAWIELGQTNGVANQRALNAR